MKTITKNNLCVLLSALMLTGCNSATKSNGSAKNSGSVATEKPRSSAVATSTPTVAPTETTESKTKEEKKTVDATSKEENKLKSLQGAMKYSLPDGWEIIATGIESRYIEVSTDYIGIQKGDKKIAIMLLMRSPAGIGRDPVYEVNIDETKIGGHTYAGGISDNGTYLDLCAEMLFDNPEHGVMFVNMTDPDGVSIDDPTLHELLESLEVNDCYGTVTVKADEVNIREGEIASAKKVGTVKKGETYKVFSISGSTEYSEYTWYNIGYLEFIADKDGEWLEYKENEW